MDLDHQPIAPRYWLCSAGFWISGIALGLLCLSAALMLWIVLTLNQGLNNALQQPWFTWAVELPITAGALLGSYLLWGRWTDAHWQRRAGLLVVLNLFDSIHWGLAQAGPVGGNPAAAMGLEWLLHNAVMIFGWLEFYLFASLASEVASHLGIRAAAEAGRTARQFSIIGLFVSVIFFLTQTRWGGGWPLLDGPETISKALMRLGITFLRVISSLQVAILCIIAAMACRRTARELAEHDAEMAGTALFGPTHRPEGDRGAPSDDPFPWS